MHCRSLKVVVDTPTTLEGDTRGAELRVRENLRCLKSRHLISVSGCTRCLRSHGDLRNSALGGQIRRSGPKGSPKENFGELGGCCSEGAEGSAGVAVTNSGQGPSKFGQTAKLEEL